MNMKNQDLQRELIQLLQRKRRHSRSLTNNELKQLLQLGGFKKENGMSSEALLSSSSCPGASLSIEGENRSLDIKTNEENK